MKNVLILFLKLKIIGNCLTYNDYFIILDKIANLLFIKTVPRIEKNPGYKLATVLISSFCRDLHIKELPTLSHQPISMAHYRGQRYTEYMRLQNF